MRILTACEAVGGATATAEGLLSSSTTFAAARRWIAREHETSGADANRGESGKHEHELWVAAGCSMNAA